MNEKRKNKKEIDILVEEPEWIAIFRELIKENNIKLYDEIYGEQNLKKSK